MKIGSALKYARKKSGLKQNEAARCVGISQTYISQIETDSKMPSMQIIQSICDCYKAPLALVLWRSLSENDIKKNKLKTYRELKPVVDNLIEQFF